MERHSDDPTHRMVFHFAFYIYDHHVRHKQRRLILCHPKYYYAKLEASHRFRVKKLDKKNQMYDTSPVDKLAHMKEVSYETKLGNEFTSMRAVFDFFLEHGAKYNFKLKIGVCHFSKNFLNYQI